jgi:predicted N-acetyltransferase YhbS
VLKELYVRREYQRRGIGNMLVQWGVRKADELGLLAYTEATPAGPRACGCI